jgi:hypothetical protein
MRIAGQSLLLNLCVWSNVRETAQILILNDGSYHPHDVGHRSVWLGPVRVLVRALCGCAWERASTKQRQENARQENKDTD